jgi:flagellar biosynthesis regulator FlaF
MSQNKLINIQDIKTDNQNFPLIYSDLFEDLMDEDTKEYAYQIQGIINTSNAKIVKVGISNQDTKVLIEQIPFSKKIEIKIISYMFNKKKFDLDIHEGTYPILIAHVFSKKNKKNKEKLKEIFSIGIYFTFSNSKDIDVNNNIEYNGKFFIGFLMDNKLQEIEQIKVHKGTRNIEKLLGYYIYSNHFQHILKQLKK